MRSLSFIKLCRFLGSKITSIRIITSQKSFLNGLRGILLKFEAKIILNRFIKVYNDKESLTVKFVYKTENAPPTFGDLLQTLMFVRFLALSGFKIDFVLNSKNVRSDWQSLKLDEQEKLKDDFFNLVKKILPKNCTLGSSKDVYISNKIFFFDHKKIHLLAPYLLFMIINKYKFEIPENYLLSKKLNSNSKYVSMHVRRGLWDLKRNIDIATITKDIKFLQRYFPNHPIMILSTLPGLNSVFSDLATIYTNTLPNNNKLNIIKQPSDGYINCMEYVLGSDFYLQRSGGGLSIIAIYSKIPYVIISESKYPWVRYKKFMPWSSSNQFFISAPRNVMEYNAFKII